MASPTLVASILTVVPAMGLIYYVLRRYEGYFEQNRLFFALTVGLFAGLLAKFLEVQLFPFDDPRILQPDGRPLTVGTLVYSAAYTMAGFAMLAGLAMGAVLGFRKFRARKDTPYYGVSLGLAFGAMHTMPLFALSIRDHVDPAIRADAAALATYLLVLAFATGLIMVHGAAAVWVGRGSAAGRLWKGVVHGSLLLMPALGVTWLWLRDLDADGAFRFVLALASLGYGIFLTLVTQRKVLDAIVPPEIRDQVRRERRRAARRGGA
ncbi:MAG TPA: hypothetical protein VM286_09590 [Candidatus Thermoplasmatota archaeon]|nr:hypothetical protein [Candidatus Thermoplasmatota archaeon]